MAMELKHLNPQHVMDVTGKAIDEISRLRTENAELKQELEEKDAFIKTLGEGQADLAREIERIKQKLEDAQATAYAESVDAGMENVKLKRALWLARAERASDKARIFYFAETCGVELNIDGFSNKEKGRTKMCTSRWWRLTWLKVERKCRAMAEKFGG